MLGGTRFVGRHLVEALRRGRAHGHGLQPRAHAAAVAGRRAAHGRPRHGRPGVAARARVGTPAWTSTAICRSMFEPRPSCWPIASGATHSSRPLPSTCPGQTADRGDERRCTQVPELEVDAARAGALRPAQGRLRAGGGARVPRSGADPPPGHRGRALRPHEPLHLVGRARRARRRRCWHPERRSSPVQLVDGRDLARFAASLLTERRRRESSTSAARRPRSASCSQRASRAPEATRRRPG